MTPIYRNQLLEEASGFSEVWIKDESHHPTGTFKDRRSKLIMETAKKKSAQKLVIISAGNAAYSLAKHAQGTGIEVATVIDESLDPSIRRVLENIFRQVIALDLSKEALGSDRLISMVREDPKKCILDVTNGYHNAYAKIIDELQHQLTQMPTTIVVPTGSAEAMVGLIVGLTRHQMNQTAVVGVRSETNERLRSNFIYGPYGNVLKLPLSFPKTVVEYCSGRTDDQVLEYVPPNVRAEAASAYAFEFLVEGMRYTKGVTGDRIVIINSGCGKILEVAKRNSFSCE